MGHLPPLPSRLLSLPSCLPAAGDASTSSTATGLLGVSITPAQQAALLNDWLPVMPTPISAASLPPLPVGLPPPPPLPPSMALALQQMLQQGAQVPAPAQLVAQEQGLAAGTAPASGDGLQRTASGERHERAASGDGHGGAAASGEGLKGSAVGGGDEREGGTSSGASGGDRCFDALEALAAAAEAEADTAAVADAAVKAAAVSARNFAAPVAVPTVVGTGGRLKFSDLEQGGYFDMPLQTAASTLGVGVTTLKKVSC